MGVVAINFFVRFVHFYFESLKISEIFQRKKMMKRLFRGSSSRSSKDKKNEENKKRKYNLPRTAEVRPCEWPCGAFLRAAKIHDDFYYLAENTGLTDFLHD